MYLRYLCFLITISCLPSSSVRELSNSSSSSIPSEVIIESGVSQEENQEDFIINYNNPTVISNGIGTFIVNSNKFLCPTSLRDALIEYCGTQCDLLNVQGAYLLQNNSGYRYSVTLRTSLLIPFSITIPSSTLYTLENPATWYNNSLTFNFQVNPTSSNPTSSNPTSSNPSPSGEQIFALTYSNPFIVNNGTTTVIITSNTKICPTIFKNKIHLACQGKCNVTSSIGYVLSNGYKYYFTMNNFTELPTSITIPGSSLSSLDDITFKYQSSLTLEFKN